MENTLKEAIKILEEINNLFNQHPSYEEGWREQKEYETWEAGLKDLIKYIKFFLASMLDKKKTEREIQILQQKLEEFEEEYPHLKGTLERLQEEVRILNNYLTSLGLLEKRDMVQNQQKEVIHEVLLHKKWNDRFVSSHDSQELIQIHSDLQERINEAQELLKEEDLLMKKILSSWDDKMQSIKRQI